MSEEKISYVYRHVNIISGETFYIGRGNKKHFKRARMVHGRSKYWEDYVKNNEYYIEILSCNLSWEVAGEIEVLLIDFYGRKHLGKGNLLNRTKGNDGGGIWIE